MQSINAEDVLDIGMVGTSGTQLAKNLRAQRQSMLTTCNFKKSS